MYVAVKGGEKAIENAHALLARKRRGDAGVPELSVAQIMEQMALAVDRVMTEGSLYDPELAALAIKQAQGDLVEAIFLLRAYRTTLPRLAVTEPLDTAKMTLKRRISATFKDLPGGQLLGPTFDYTHRLLDFSLLDEPGSQAGETDRGQSGEPDNGASDTAATPIRDADAPTDQDHPAAPRDENGTSGTTEAAAAPRVTDLLLQEGLIEDDEADDEAPVGDLTRDPVTLPCGRDIRLQNLARADEGFVLALGYSTQRGFGNNHPFAGEIRMGEVAVQIVPEELGFAVEIGEITITECQMVTKFKGNKHTAPTLTRGYGLTFGFCERKAMAMSLVDRSLRSSELEEDIVAPAQDEEFVLMHSDNVEAQGFTSHLKLPHHVDFQGDLVLLRQMRREYFERHNPAEADHDDND